MSERSARNMVPGFAARLREVRRARNMTQQQLALAAGTSVPAVCKLEQERRAPSLELAYRLARALGCSLDDLVQKPGQKIPKKVID